METALKRLRDLLPDEAIDTSDTGRFQASMDNLRLSHLPEAVLRPADEEALAHILEVANTEGIPLTPRGAGSATTGATTPIRGGWVVDLSGWNQLSINANAMTAFVQPGVTVDQLDAAAEEAGLFYPPDPGSRRYATIGGTIACNAGGLRGAKYGVTRDYVLGLEGFLPTGEFVRWGGNLRKFSCGYNIRDLWIGSEGTLGIVTGAILRLLPRPQTRTTALIAYPDETAALQAARRVREARLIPSILEFLDRETVGGTLRFWQRVSPERLIGLAEDWLAEAPALLLVETDGAPHQAQIEMDSVLRAVAKGSLHIQQATTPAQAEALWTIRRGCSQAMFEMGTHKLNEDVVLPLDEQIEFLAYVAELRHAIDLPMPTFGHVADGNFHVHIMYHADDAAEAKRAQDGLRQLMERVSAMDGAISGEHGIGLAKSPFMHLQHGPDELKVMRRIKRLFDPNNILNPGKLWDPLEVWNHPRTEIRMPWDH